MLSVISMSAASVFCTVLLTSEWFVVTRVALSCRVKLPIVNVSLLTVSLKCRVRTPLSMSRSKDSREGLSRSGVNVDTAIAEEIGICLTRLPALSAAS